MNDEKARVQKIAFRERLYRRRYIVPNAVTFGNFFCGFLTIIYASSGRFEKAVAAIAIAFLLDGLDGRVARKLNATSKFGGEFDSFADMVSFGVAPAMLMYHWAFLPLADEFGVFICFIYALCAASRLARFNISEENLKSFTGLPTPAAAAMIASIVFLMPSLEPSQTYVAGATAVSVLLSFLMVSKIEYFSIKSMKVTGFNVFAPLSIAVLIALIWYKPRFGFVVLIALYIFSGVLQHLGKKMRKNTKGKDQDIAA